VEVNVVSTERIAQLKSAVDEFSVCVESLPEKSFLQAIDEWTPRDVVAHLIPWNRYFLEVCQGLQAGKTPTYYSDTANDYANINAEFVRRHSSRDRRLLLDELWTSFQEFHRYLLTLDPAEWNADRGVTHVRGGAATIGRVVDSLTSDYAHHTRQIREWAASWHRNSLPEGPQ
jgi:hypothetical protein